MFADIAKIDALAVHLQTTNTVRGRMNSRRLSGRGTLPSVLPQLKAPLRGIWGELDFSARGRLELYAERLNEMLGLRFWGQTVTAWEQVPMPMYSPAPHNPSLLLDWNRFGAAQLRSD